MLSFFESLIDGVMFIVDFIVNILRTMSTFITTLYHCLDLPILLAGIIPPVLYASLLMFLSITVVRLIFGR